MPQRREDAEKAQQQLNGIMLHAVELRIGWGKSVPLPAVPLYVPGLGTSAGALPAASTRPAFADLIVPIKPWEVGEGEAGVHTVSGITAEVGTSLHGACQGVSLSVFVSRVPGLVEFEHSGPL